MSAKTTNPELIDTLKTLIRAANEEEAAIWDAVADKLRKSKHKRVAVNISRINRHTTDDETVVVPGKVLGSGVLTHRVNVAALSFSKQAREKIEGAGGKYLTITTLIQENPEGSGIRIIG
jgi:large subunit ribosomal protein L18e